MTALRSTTSLATFLWDGSLGRSDFPDVFPSLDMSYLIPKDEQRSKGNIGLHDVMNYSVVNATMHRAHQKVTGG